MNQTLSDALRATLRIDTPLGPFDLAADEGGLTHCQPSGSLKLPKPGTAASAEVRAQLETAASALDAYFAGQPDPWQGLCLHPEGSGFQLRVWEALRSIPYGRTRSYRELACSIGQPRAARAVGQANHHNPLAIFVPCHRVITADGGLGGYAGGLERKRWLLAHEAAPPRAAATPRQFVLGA